MIIIDLFTLCLRKMMYKVSFYYDSKFEYYLKIISKILINHDISFIYLFYEIFRVMKTLLFMIISYYLLGLINNYYQLLSIHLRKKRLI